MDKLQEILHRMNDNEKDHYCTFLAEVVGEAKYGGYGQFLGDIRKMVFATADERLKALEMLNRYWK